MDKKPAHYKFIEEIDDSTLRKFVKEFFEKRFGKGSDRDQDYFEKWFQRFRKMEYMAYMDQTSKGIYFGLIKKYGVKDEHEVATPQM